MTITETPAATRAASPGERAPGAPGRVFGTTVTIVSALLLAFAAHLTVLSALRHDRAQQTAFADFRRVLADGTAPVGQTDAATGRLIDQGTPVALLTAPSIGLREVVFEGTSSGVLMDGPGHRRDTVLPGQEGWSYVYGRQASYGGPFGRIGELRPGDVLGVVTGQGEHAFRVTGVRRAGAPEPAPVAAGAGRLTLVTAEGTPFMPDGAVWVDAELTSQAQPAPPRPLATRALDASEDAMGWEPGALVALLLWAQSLLLAVAAVIWVRLRKGGWHAWVVGVPALAATGLFFCSELSRLMPNLL
ncbi:sortase [Actinorhabdospora filicis]|uniref:Sortase n=1 Tax=Actinorhabdospora filicis TaxID=1785913 RepID=A0A9W6W790_9ACTN|nr:class E sortase [Actinorhabdospora filicis]GLZ75713.1 sortase [Actinorhabdospora filicis]